MNVIKIKKLGIAISTYTEEGTHPHRYKIIEDSLNSLVESIKKQPLDLEIYIIVTVDGKVPQQHTNLLNKFSSDIQIIQKEHNGGISKTKNTGIRILLEKGIDVGILADDDVLYHNGWIETYVKYIEDFQLHHHTWHDKRKFEHLKSVKPNSRALKSFSYIKNKGYDLFKHNGGCGIFLTFTPKLIETIGYFKVMPGKIGSEHLQFTLRANRAGLINQPKDIVNSYKFIEHIGVLDIEADPSQEQVIHSVSDNFRKKEDKNSGLNTKDLEKYFTCIE